MAKLFGHPVYRVSDVTNQDGTAEVTATLNAAARAFAYARVDVANVATSSVLVDRGFRIVDVAVTFARLPSNAPVALPPDISVREAGSSDFDAIMDIAGRTFKYSRF